MEGKYAHALKLLVNEVHFGFGFLLFFRVQDLLDVHDIQQEVADQQHQVNQTVPQKLIHNMYRIKSGSFLTSRRRPCA